MKACDGTSVDECSEIDAAECIVYSYDECKKDHAGCFEGADDICTVRDLQPCYGAGEQDYGSQNW